MKRIALISDTHGYIDEHILKYLADCDEIWHAGDWGSVEISDRLRAMKTVKGVWGNIDGRELRLTYPENHIFECEGMKVLMTHIAGYPGHYSARAKALIREHRPGIVVCGHSHILKVIYDKELQHLHLNPGAAGIQGFQTVRTLLQFSIEEGIPKNMEVVELGRKA